MKQTSSRWFIPLTNLTSTKKRFTIFLKRKLASGLLYNEYCTLVKSPVVDRAYRKYMERMVELGLVKAVGKGRWREFELSV
jgi:hypothetical protein